MNTVSPITYRAGNGFGPATNEAIVSALGSFRKYCTDEENCVNSTLGPTEPIPLYEAPILSLPDELLLHIATYLDDVDRNTNLNNLALMCRRIHNVAREVLM